MTFVELEKKYQNNAVEDDGSYMSDEAKSFAKDIKRYFADVATESGAELVKFNIGHYYVSGFIEKNGKYMYFSYSIPRGESAINLYAGDFLEGILVRSAESTSDFTGGRNQFCNFKNFKDAINSILA